jgi:predicted cytidylate kinase
MKKNRITLSGFAGTGKSTIGMVFSDKYGYEFISVGNFSRDFAQKEYGMTINQFQEKCKNEPELDSLIDERFSKECNSKSTIVVDYRLGFKFINDAFHVLLVASDEVAASRISKANRKNEDTDLKSIKERNAIMKQRFIDAYGVDFTDIQNYHIVINTDNLTPEEIAEFIINSSENHE